MLAHAHWLYTLATGTDTAVIAEARGLFIEVDIDHFRRGGQELPDRWTDWTDKGVVS